MTTKPDPIGYITESAASALKRGREANGIDIVTRPLSIWKVALYLDVPGASIDGQLTNTPAAVKKPGSTPRVDALMAKWDDDGATRGRAFIELRDLARDLEAGLQLPELNDELRGILGRPNFACRDIAMALRAGGQEIKNRAEDEQAATIHFLLGMYLQHGDGWADAAGSELRRMVAAVRT